MKCNVCNAAEDQGANQVFQCDSCKEMFVAVELDYADQALREMDREVVEAAIKWLRAPNGKRTLKAFELFVEAVTNHSDWEC